MKKYLLALLLLFAFPNALLAKGGAVTAADPRAAEAGREILRKGGSAADAAVAMMLALSVVEPQSSGIGGGGFMVFYCPGNTRHKVIEILSSFGGDIKQYSFTNHGLTTWTV